MPQLSAQHLLRWIRQSDQNEIKAANGLRTDMTDAEKDEIEQAIATRQMDEDADADIVDSAIILEELQDRGFHPAFEFEGVIVAQGVFEAMRSAIRSVKH